MKNNFWGKMTKQELLQALKIILLAKNPEKDNMPFKEKFINFFKNLYSEIKYTFSKQMLIDLVKDLKTSLTEIKNFSLTKYLNGIANDIIAFKNNIVNFFETPLTQDVFIRRGIKIKFAILDLIETVVFVVVAVALIRMYIMEIRWIPSGSMRPTLLEGDRIVVERCSRLEPQRGDIMVFYPPFFELKNTPVLVFKRLTGFFCDDIAYIKRIIGLPGEKFEIKRDATGAYAVYINDLPLDEPYIQNKYEFSPCEDVRVNCGPFVIPENNYMMLGDNRGHSLDSRFWGTLDKSRFIGRATFRFWPLNRIKTLNRT